MCTQLWLQFMIFMVAAFPGCATPPNPCPVVVTPPPVVQPAPPVVVTPPVVVPTPPPVVVVPPPKLEVMGYYAGWTESVNPPSKVDFTNMTQIQNFSATPNADGTLNLTQNHLSPTMLATAKSKGMKVLLTIGSSNTAVGFRGATANMSKFVANILTLAQGYDGVDVDWEPLEKTDYPMFTSLIKALRAALPGKILAVAIGDYPDPTGKVTLMKSLPEVDQINLMSYDLAGPWSGWVVYHDSALLSYGPAFIRSADGIVTRYLNAGVPASKLSIGVAFYGFVWGGVLKPLDTWPSTAVPSYTAIDYKSIKAQYGTLPVIWDDKAQACYISDVAGKRFITFENEQSIAAKIAYVKAKGLHGLIIWEISGGPTLLNAFK